MPIIFTLVAELLSYAYVYSDALILLAIAAFFIIPKFLAKQENGFQLTDITESVTEGIEDYRTAMKNIYAVINDVTVNDADTVAQIQGILQAKKTFK